MPHLLKTLLLAFVLCASMVDGSVAQPRFAHPAWEALLKKHVSAKGAVDYRGFIQDSLALNGYLSQLAANPPQEKYWSREEQLAYWLNAYNAYTVQLIARHYPLKSINDIKRAGAKSPWDIPFIALNGTTLPSTTSSTKSCASNLPTRGCTLPLCALRSPAPNWPPRHLKPAS
jgi:hypothetical protein